MARQSLREVSQFVDPQLGLEKKAWLGLAKKQNCYLYPTKHMLMDGWIKSGRDKNLRTRATNRA
jgi:hypothetical protein